MAKKKKGKTSNLMFDISTASLTDDQKFSLKRFDDWYTGREWRNYKKPILRIGAVGGSGKSFLLSYIAGKYGFDESNALFVGYTGQSVNRLRQFGIPAKTIHSTFLEAIEVPLTDGNGDIIKKNGIPLTKVEWRPRRFLPKNIKIVIGDEWSFVPDYLEDIMLRYNVPILVFGDPVQLPPVAGDSRFTEDTVDVFMTQIVRQAKDSEIIDLSMRIRNYDKVKADRYIDEVRFIKSRPTIEESFDKFLPFFKYADRIVTVTNQQREIITNMYRKYVIGTESLYPIEGEPLICRQNNWHLKVGDNFPLTNGMLGRAMSDVPRSAIHKSHGTYLLDFQPDFIGNDYFDGLSCDSEYLLAPFGAKPEFKPGKSYNKGAKLEWAYALTTHIMQGAESDNILFMDKWIGDPEYMRRLRYTAVTRARKFLMYMLPYNRFE